MPTFSRSAALGLIPRRLMLCLLTCVGLLSHNAAYAYEFSYQNLVLARISVDPAFDREGAVDCYMEIFRPDVWQRYRNDEFELPAKRKETLEMMDKALKAFNPKETFMIRMKDDFQEYDPKRGVFAFNPLSDTTYFTLRSGAECRAFPRELRVRFTNTALIDGIPMSMEAGRAFLNRRKSSYGSVDREVSLEVQARAVKFDTPFVVSEIVEVKVLNENGTVIHTYVNK